MSHGPFAGSGCINWPTHLRDSGEGGMWVYALVLAHDDTGVRHRDPFVHCCEVTTTIALPQANACVSHHRLYESPHGTPGTEEYVMEVMTAGPQVLAAVCLGSSGGSWGYTDGRGGDDPELVGAASRRGDSVYWECRAEDLTSDGAALVDALRKLYDRDVELVTYLDT